MLSQKKNIFQPLGNLKVFKECNLLKNDDFPNKKACFLASSFAPFCQEEKYLCSIWVQKQKFDSFFDSNLMVNFLRNLLYENGESMLYTKKTNDSDFTAHLQKFCSLTSWQILKISFYLQLLTEKKFNVEEHKIIIRENYAQIFQGIKLFGSNDPTIDVENFVLNEDVFYINEEKEEKILEEIMKNEEELFFNILKNDESFFFLCVLYGHIFELKAAEIKTKFDNLKQEIENYIEVAGIIDFATALGKILDGTSNSFLFRRANEFLPSIPLNFTALGILYFNFCLLNLRKNEVERYYSINNLPKISFINFDGFDIVENWKISPMLRNCFQYVSINLEQSKKNIDEISKIALHNIESYKNLVYIPIEISKLNLTEEEYLKSRHIYMIFEKIIFPAVRAFDPSLIVINHSFAFEMECHFANRAQLNIKTWENVIYNLCKISNYKIMFVPNAYEEKDLLKIETKTIIKEGLRRSIESFTYSEETFKNNKFYIYQIISSFLKVAQGKIPKKYKKKYYIESNELDLKVEKGFIMSKHIKEMKNKSLPILNLKTKIIKLKDSNTAKSKSLIEPIEELDEKSKDFSFQLINTIKILSLENNSMEQIKTYNLIFEEKNFYYDESARFYVLYDLKKVYFFNVRRAQQYSNFVFSFAKPNNDKIEGKQIENYSNDYFLEDFSMCYESRKAIYLIWGRKTFSITHEIKIDTTIHRLDCISDKWEVYTPYVKEDVAAIPRINTGSICFPCNSVEKCTRIYIVGGYTNDAKHYKYDYYNIIDVIGLNSSKTEYTHQQIKKEYYQEYVPLKDSQLFPMFNPNGLDSFIIVGGADGSNFGNSQSKPFLSYSVEYDLERDKMNFMSNEKLFEDANNKYNFYFSNSNKNYMINFDKQKKVNEICFINSLSNKPEKIITAPSLQTNNLPFKKSLAIIDNRKEKYDLANGTYAVADSVYGEMKLGQICSIKVEKTTSQVLNLPREFIKSMNFYNTSDKFCVGFTKNFLVDLHVNADKSAKINFHSVILNSKPENYNFDVQARNFGEETSVIVDQGSQCFYFFYTIPERIESEKNMDKLDFRNMRPKGTKKEIPKASKITNSLPVILNGSFIIGYENQEKIIYSVGGVPNDQDYLKKCQGSMLWETEDSITTNLEDDGRAKIINHKIFITKNDDINFKPMKNNLMEMKNPILAINQDFMIALYPNVINNLNDLNFYDSELRNINIRSKCRNMKNIIYVEILDRKNTKAWKFFIIDLDYDQLIHTEQGFLSMHRDDEEVSENYFGKIYRYKENNDEVSFFISKNELRPNQNNYFKEVQYFVLSLKINSIGTKVFKSENVTTLQIEEEEKRNYFRLNKSNLKNDTRLSDFIIYNNEIYDKSGSNIKLEVSKKQ